MTGTQSRSRGRAYRQGWHDGRYAEPCCFTDNQRLARLEAPSGRLDYYGGHRDGREARPRGAWLLEAS
jgi:hypothetical protein